MKRVFALALATMAAAGSAVGQTIYNTSPEWVSADTPYSTGGALVDLDRDGWLDFVVANGNDIRRERLVVYYNVGDGTFPTTPDWYSSDDEYNGHLSVADVDGDGWLDVAVGLTMDDPGTATARLYMNNGGTLSSLPDWETSHELAAFQVSFGDVNNDGRPDLAVGTGFGYEGSHRWHNYVYVNDGGMLETTASWVSDDIWDHSDIFFCDVDNDGWMDLIGIGENTDTWVYLNDAGTLATTATWHTTDNPGQFSVMGTYGDVDGDGWAELFVADNTQLFTGSGDFRRYDGLSSGLFTTTPTWTYYDGYGSAVALADIDADGDLDLATGAWFDRTRYFLNTGGLFPGSPTWTSAQDTVVEAICFGDVDRDSGRRPIESFDVTTTPGRHLFQLAHQPIEDIEYVLVDGVPLDPDEFTFGFLHGWVSVGPEATTSVTVRYRYSLKPEMAITNWDAGLGNQLYYNMSAVIGYGDFDGDLDVDLDDVGEFAACFTGPDGGPVVPECVAGDFDSDDDVDCDDWMALLAVWSGTGEPPELAECTSMYPLPAPPPHNTPKNRYVSFDPNNGDETVAFEVALVASPSFPGSVGVLGWVGEPDVDGIARVTAEPFYTDSWPAVVHVGDCGIIPVATYEVRWTVDGLAYSYPVALATVAQPEPAKWGDCVGQLVAMEWTEPNGVVNFNDITAAIQYFTSATTAPHLTWVDVEPEVPNKVLNFSDIMQIVLAFQGEDYPFSAPADCP